MAFCAGCAPCAVILQTQRVSSELQVLSLSDNDKLSGELPACWFGHSKLQELQLAGLSDLHGRLPDATQVSSGSAADVLCGFGKLKYINMAGIIGDAGLGFEGTKAGTVIRCGLGLLCGYSMLAPNPSSLVPVAGAYPYIDLIKLHYQLLNPFVVVCPDISPVLSSLSLTAGNLPESLGFCKDLLYLDLSGHSLGGNLPALPPHIEFLNVSSNGLTGSLPEFAVDAELQYLDLSFNRWVGGGPGAKGLGFVV